ncbi:hypothetical protein F5887DRAFT_1073311 [Amanita rubescens]|nr:hypothetical protein F5887DRAFT_1073311 [Amanita rubescens]
MRKAVSKDTRFKYSDQKFKKAYQVVDRPKVMDHNINDEYFRHPPQNLRAGKVEWYPVEKKKEEWEAQQMGVIGQPGIGRVRPEDALGRLARGEPLV